MIFHSPLKVPIKGSRKSFSINLNEYRNAHYRKLNDAKKSYSAIMYEQIKKIPPINTPIILKIYLWEPDNRERDVSNFCSIADKFFLDALVNNKIIPDDNKNYVKGSVYGYGGIDCKNPRCDIYIETEVT